MTLGVPGRLRPRIFSTFGTTRVVGRQPNAPAACTPGEIPGTHFQRLSRPQGTTTLPQAPLRDKYYHKSNNNNLTRDVSTALKYASRSMGTKPRSNVPVYIILASVRFARSSNRFISSSSERTFTCLPVEYICDLVSNQESLVTVSSRNVTLLLHLLF